MDISALYNLDVKVDNIAHNTKDVTSSTIFYCLKGNVHDGHEYAVQAEKLGAVAIVCSHHVEGLTIPQIIVENVELELSKASAMLYDYPAKKLKIIGVTGTDGKTTITTILEEFLNIYSNCAYIGTNGVKYNDYSMYIGCTTPFPPVLHSYLNDFANNGVKYVSMEVSSHALAMYRVNDIRLDAAIISNVTSDHLDFHKTIENYVDAKMSIANIINNDGVLVLNANDKYYQKFRDNYNGNIVSYGIDVDADYKATNVKCYIDHLTYTLINNGTYYEVDVNLIGEFNVSNTLSIIAYLHYNRYKIDDIIDFMRNITPISGRANFIDEGQDFCVLVDFAHTENGVKSILEYMKKTLEKTGKIITVIGSIGERDFDRRISLARLATTYSDYTIFSNDQPRRESPMKILQDMADNAVNDQYECIENREIAVEKAIKMATTGDIVLLLGKGAETEIEFDGYTIEYSDIDTAIRVLKSLKI